MPDPPRFAFSVAVVGTRDAMDSYALSRLIDLLVNRHSDTHHIVLVSTGTGPDLEWAHDRGWSIHLEPGCSGCVKRDCALVATCDAIVILGDPAPWSRLLRLAREARVPTRVFRDRPRLPPRPDYDPELM